MLRATAIVRKAAVKPDRVADTVTLDHEGRHRRRVALNGEGGLDFLLDLDKATALDDGDALKLEDGRLVAGQGRAASALLEIRAENPLRLLRVAWHIGNRHTPAEIDGRRDLHRGRPRARRDGPRPGLHGDAGDAPFQPERGAYDHDCGHDHRPRHHHHGHDASRARTITMTHGHGTTTHHEPRHAPRSRPRARCHGHEHDH